MQIPFHLEGSKTFSRFLVILATAAALTLPPGCTRERPVKIGFSGCLTGRLSDLGIAGRNGAMLAVEQINRAGGINGRRVELLIRDDKHNAETAKKVDMELINEGVAAIIGHMTSSMTMAVMPLINREKIIMVGTTVSTDKLTGLDDWFIRVTDSSRAISDHQAAFASQELGLKRVTCIYDLANRAYTESWYDNFTSEFKKLGGENVIPVTFSSDAAFSYRTITEAILKSAPQAVVIVASALHSAMICNNLKKYRSDIPILCSAWAQTDELLRHGGKAVEGVVFFHFFNQNSRNERYIAFKEQYRKRFNSAPDFAAVCGYDAAALLLNGLSISARPDSLKKTLLNRGIHKGLQGDLQLDKYGDAKRKYYRITVTNGEFKTADDS